MKRIRLMCKLAGYIATGLFAIAVTTVSPSNAYELPSFCEGLFEKDRIDCLERLQGALRRTINLIIDNHPDEVVRDLLLNVKESDKHIGLGLSSMISSLLDKQLNRATLDRYPTIGWDFYPGLEDAVRKIENDSIIIMTDGSGSINEAIHRTKSSAGTLHVQPGSNTLSTVRPKDGTLPITNFRTIAIPDDSNPNQLSQVNARIEVLEEELHKLKSLKRNLIPQSEVPRKESESSPLSSRKQADVKPAQGVTSSSHFTNTASGDIDHLASESSVAVGPHWATESSFKCAEDHAVCKTKGVGDLGCAFALIFCWGKDVIPLAGD